MKQIKKRYNSDDIVIENYDDLEWEEKEIDELYKLMRRFPVGTRKRWEMIYKGFKNKRRSQQAIIKKATAVVKRDRV